MLARRQLDRNSEVPLFRQLHAAIEMSIIEGDLTDGSSLPSVRALARELDVAPVTVIQAYKELQKEGLVQAIAKRGFFVSVAPDQPAVSERYLRVQELIDRALAVALQSGIDEREFSRLAMERARRFRSDQRVVAVFGLRDASLEIRVETTSSALADLNVDVIGLAFEDVEPLGLDERAGAVGGIDYFLVSVGQIEQAAELLGSSAGRIVPMTRVPIPQAVAFVAEQPESARFGIVAESDSYANRLIAVLRRIRPTAVVAEIAIVDERNHVAEVVRNTDAVLVGSLASRKIDPALLDDPRVIEFASVPDESTLTKLRSRIIESRRTASVDPLRPRNGSSLVTQ